MPEPTVRFNLQMPVDVDQQVRLLAGKSGKPINATLIALLRQALALS